MRALPDNALRYDARSRKGHVESYFWRANDPHRRRAIWLKATIFSPRPDSTVAELWCIVFDQEKGRTFADKQTVPFASSTFATSGGLTSIALAGATFSMGEGEGTAQGSLREARWDLRMERVPGALGEPLCMYPWEALVEAPFPKSKLLTPWPALRVDGQIEVWGETIELEGWIGMQGHNWGQSHAWEYAWGQCFFAGRDGAPDAWMEGFSGKIKLAGRPTPWLSALVVRRGEAVYRFDRVFDFWRQKVRIDDLSWTLELGSAHGRASLRVEAEAEAMVCLGYHNPDGRLSYCLNSKLSGVTLAVNPAYAESFRLTSEHGGALEFLRNQPDPRFPEVV